MRNPVAVIGQKPDFPAIFLPEESDFLAMYMRNREDIGRACASAYTDMFTHDEQRGPWWIRPNDEFHHVLLWNLHVETINWLSGLGDWASNWLFKCEHVKEKYFRQWKYFCDSRAAGWKSVSLHMMIYPCFLNISIQSLNESDTKQRVEVWISLSHKNVWLIWVFLRKVKLPYLKKL